MPCRLNIDPVGITGTPVIDPATNIIYAVIQTGPPQGHALVGLDTETGAGRVLASADPPGANTATQFNRPALALANGRVSWAYGGADCGTYHGTVVSTLTDGSSPVTYTVPSTNRGSFWGTSGPAVDGNGNVWPRQRQAMQCRAVMKITERFHFEPSKERIRRSVRDATWR